MNFEHAVLIYFARGGEAQQRNARSARAKVETKETEMSDDNYYTCPLCLLVCHIDDTEACACFHTEKDIDDSESSSCAWVPHA